MQQRIELLEQQVHDRDIELSIFRKPVVEKETCQTEETCHQSHLLCKHSEKLQTKSV